MKAKFVNEEIGFKRGLDPKDVLGLGMNANPDMVKDFFVEALKDMGQDPLNYNLKEAPGHKVWEIYYKFMGNPINSRGDIPSTSIWIYDISPRYRIAAGGTDLPGWLKTDDPYEILNAITRYQIKMEKNNIAERRNSLDKIKAVREKYIK